MKIGDLVKPIEKLFGKDSRVGLIIMIEKKDYGDIDHVVWVMTDKGKIEAWYYSCLKIVND